MTTANPDARVEAILPGLIYVTGQDPRNKIYVWGDMPTPGFHIAAFDGHSALKSLPSGMVTAIRSATIIGFGSAAALDERIHQICLMYVAAGIAVKGRYRVEGSEYHTVPAGPFEPTRSALIPFVPEYEEVTLELAGGLAQAEFRVASAQHGLELERIHHNDVPAFEEAMRTAGSRVVDLLKEGRPVQQLSAEQQAHLIHWLLSRSGYATALDLTHAFEPPQRFVDHWTDLLTRVPASAVPIPASLLAIGAWRTGRAFLARQATDLAEKCASDGLPPLHEIAGDLIKNDILQRTSSGLR